MALGIGSDVIPKSGQTQCPRARKNWLIKQIFLSTSLCNILPAPSFQVFALKAQITIVNDCGLQAFSFGESLPFSKPGGPIEGLFTNLSFNFRFVKTGLVVKKLAA